LAFRVSEDAVGMRADVALSALESGGRFDYFPNANVPIDIEIFGRRENTLFVRGYAVANVIGRP
jgi:hypothetical protein